MIVLRKNFYNQNTLKVAQDLLGCFLIRKNGKKIIGVDYAQQAANWKWNFRLKN